MQGPILPGARWLIAGLLAFAAGMSLAAAPQVEEGFVNAPTAEVWRLFASGAAFGQSVAEADSGSAPPLRIGGELRSMYTRPLNADQGSGTGSAGMTAAGALVHEILAYEPERMLALRLKEAPATLPYRAAARDTWTVVYLNPAGEDMTQVRIVGVGYGQDARSQELREAWSDVQRELLARIAKPYWPKCAKCERDAGQQ